MYFTAYDNALTFHHAYQILIDRHMAARKEANYLDFGLVLPALANGAFVCELYLKALLGREIRGHRLYTDLYKKYEQMQPQGAQRITDAVIQIFRKALDSDYDELLFKQELIKHERVFEELRYWHEGKKESPVYNLDFIYALLKVLHAVAQEKFGVRPVQN